MFDKMKLEKSSSLLDTRLLKLKSNTNNTNIASTNGSSSLLKNNRQFSNASIGSSINGGMSNRTNNVSLSQLSINSSSEVNHKRVGSTISKPISMSNNMKISKI